MRSPSPSFSPVDLAVEHPSWSYDENIIYLTDEDDEDIPGASSSGPTLYEELSKELCSTLETTLEITLQPSFETSRAPVLFKRDAGCLREGKIHLNNLKVTSWRPPGHHFWTAAGKQQPTVQLETSGYFPSHQTHRVVATLKARSMTEQADVTLKEWVAASDDGVLYSFQPKNSQSCGLHCEKEELQKWKKKGVCLMWLEISLHEASTRRVVQTVHSDPLKWDEAKRSSDRRYDMAKQQRVSEKQRPARATLEADWAAALDKDDLVALLTLPANDSATSSGRNGSTASACSTNHQPHPEKLRCTCTSVFT